MLFRRKKKDTPARGTTETRLRQLKVPVDLLRTGMHVARPDRPWTDIPVLFQRFTIDTERQIAMLRHYCQWVIVEVEDSLYRELAPKAQALFRPRLKALPEQRPLVEELPRAERAFRNTQSFVDSLLEDVRWERPLSLDQARPVIDQCVESMLANANAMFWLGRIRHQDAYTAEHCLRVAVLAIAMGRSLELPREDLVTLGLCGMLHDIGKLKVPDEILNKPAALRDDEMAVMRRHTEHGHALLSAHHQLEPIVRDTALSHHERLDGKGYPNALPEHRISRFARIIAIVDAFDAMTSDRCYREGISTSEALRVLYRARGRQFDPELVEHFIRMMGLYPPGSLVELSSGEVAVVLATNPNQKLNPRVEIVLDASKNPCPGRLLNLAEEPVDSEGRPYRIAQALPDGSHGFYLHERIREQLAAIADSPSGPDGSTT